MDNRMKAFVRGVAIGAIAILLFLGILWLMSVGLFLLSHFIGIVGVTAVIILIIFIILYLCGRFAMAQYDKGNMNILGDF